MDTKYKIFIGLEVHIEPSCITKMFCSCPANHFAAAPNTNTCPICLGLPGALPFANEEAINKIVTLGLALGCKVNNKSKFYRKHYFYPDLPKGFQTSQLDSPICEGGSLNGFEIDHIHLEEDAGKLQHMVVDGKKVSLVDFNRSGVALIELVTKPVFHQLEDVGKFLKEVQLICRYCNVSQADMEKGTMRLEANISLSTDGNLPNYKVELKNINSFKFLEKALVAEIERQTKALEAGEKLIQETRGYDEDKNTTFSQREKSDSDDYRYFPEPDLPDINVSDELVNELRSQLPDLPEEKRKSLVEVYGLSPDYARILAEDLSRVNYFESCAKLNNNYQLIASLIINKKMDKSYPEPEGLVTEILKMQKKSFASVGELELAIDQVLQENTSAVESYKSGKGQSIGFLIGQVQKKLNGNADPRLASEKLIQKLNA